MASKPTPLERELLAVYRDAEHYLLLAATRQVAKTAKAQQDTTAGLAAVRAAAAQTVAALNRATPGLIVAAIRAAAKRGGLAAAAALGTRVGPRAVDALEAVNTPALDVLAATAVGRVQAAHSSILRTVPDAYRRAVARATPAVLVGAETRLEASQRAWWDLSQQGITGFVDKAGRRWRLSTYVEMATRTAVNRAEIDGKHAVWAARGHDLVQVVGANDRCPKCRPWHAAVLSISGSQSGEVQVEHGIRDGEMVTVHVTPLEVARAAGWQHPNCRCGTRIFRAGVSKPDRLDPTTAGYEARQQQRAIERGIRAAKEKVDTALDPAAAKAARVNVRAHQERMREHLKDHPHLLRYREREQIGAGNIPTAARRAELAAEKWADIPVLDRDPDAASRRAKEAHARRRTADSLRRARAERLRMEAEQARRAAELAAREDDGR